MLTPGLERLELDPAAREILELADGCGLHPRISRSGTGGHQHGLTEVIVDSCQRKGLFGTVTIGARGEVACAHLVHGNWGEQRLFGGADAVRAVIASWAALAGEPS
jgi:hypothetical protein